MVIDSSALIAIIRHEPEREAFIKAISSADTRLVGAPTLMEAGMVALGRYGERALADVSEFCGKGAIETVAFEPDHLASALDAFRRFGKGRHPAGLNFGDCLSYALAKTTGEPLLFKGDDFAQTDVKAAL